MAKEEPKRQIRGILFGDVTPNKFPATTADDSSAGLAAWSNTGNVTAKDGLFATVGLDSSVYTRSHYLNLQNFGFSIPAGSIIQGIEVWMSWFDPNATNAVFCSPVYLIKAGVIQTGYNGSNLWYATSSQRDVQIAGSNGNNWQGSVGPSDINATNFGVAIELQWDQSVQISASTVINVDAVWIIVTYQLAAQETGGGISPIVSGGTKKVIYSKSGGGISQAVGGGVRQLQYVKKGGGLSTAIAGGQEVKATVFLKPGGAISHAVAGASPKIIFYVKRGGGVSLALAGTSKQVGATKTAGAISQALGGGRWDSVTFQWQSNAGGVFTNITGATGQTYIPATSDIGNQIRVGSTATNATGSTLVYSSPTNVVTASNTYSKTGGGISQAVAGGTKPLGIKTGGGISKAVAGGTHPVTARIFICGNITGVLAHAGGGVSSAVSGGNKQPAIKKTGGGISRAIAGGVREQSETGGAVSKLIAGAVKIVIVTKTGGGVSNVVSGGQKIIDAIHTGGGISITVAGGVKLGTVFRTGGGVSTVIAGTSKFIIASHTAGGISFAIAGSAKSVTTQKVGGAESTVIGGAFFGAYILERIGGGVSTAISGVTKQVSAKKVAGGVAPLLAGGLYSKNLLKVGGGVSFSIAGGPKNKNVIFGGGGISILIAGGGKHITTYHEGGGITSLLAGGSNNILIIGIGGATSVPIAGANKSVAASKVSGAIAYTIAGGLHGRGLSFIGGGISQAVAGGVEGGDFPRFYFRSAGGIVITKAGGSKKLVIVIQPIPPEVLFAGELHDPVLLDAKFVTSGRSFTD